MISMKSLKRRGIRKILFDESTIMSSKVDAICFSKNRRNETSILPKYDLFDKELLSSFKMARKSSLVSNSRKKLEEIDSISKFFWKNGSDASENKMAGKKARKSSLASNTNKKLAEVDLISMFGQNGSGAKENKMAGKATRKSSLASNARKELEKVNSTSNKFWQCDSDAKKNKMAGKKAYTRDSRISMSSYLPGKIKSSSIKCSLSGWKSSDLKDIATENEVNYSNNKSGKKLQEASKKKKKRSMVLEEQQMIESSGKKEAVTEKKNKKDCEFESRPVRCRTSKKVRISETETGKSDRKQENPKSFVGNKAPIDWDTEPSDILRLKYEALYSDYHTKKNNKGALDLVGDKQEKKPSRKSSGITQMKKTSKQIPIRRSARIAAKAKDRLSIA